MMVQSDYRWPVLVGGSSAGNERVDLWISNIQLIFGYPKMINGYPKMMYGYLKLIYTCWERTDLLVLVCGV